jgi:hypothetical protein
MKAVSPKIFGLCAENAVSTRTKNGISGETAVKAESKTNPKAIGAS